jgi:hypothetical protein
MNEFGFNLLDFIQAIVAVVAMGIISGLLLGEIRWWLFGDLERKRL